MEVELYQPGKLPEFDPVRVGALKHVPPLSFEPPRFAWRTFDQPQLITAWFVRAIPPVVIRLFEGAQAFRWSSRFDGFPVAIVR